MGQVEVLASVMNQRDESILDKMNINSDAIIVNQCGRTGKKEFFYRKGKIRWYDFAETGAALSRNVALDRARDQYAIFADDDVTYINDYEKVIVSEFENHQEADVILFNVKSLNSERKIRLNNQWRRIRIWNGLRYGTFNIAFRTRKVKKRSISFNLFFGGGARFGCGEDTLFIVTLLKNGFRVYASPRMIATVEQKKSTWFHGFDEKYLFDRGVLFRAIFGKWAFLYSFRYLIKHKNEYGGNFSVFEAWEILKKGEKHWKTL